MNFAEYEQPFQHLPPLVTHLNFGSSLLQDANNIPHTVTSLVLGRFNTPITRFPPSLTYLSVQHTETNAYVLPPLPPSLTYLDCYVRGVSLAHLSKLKELHIIMDYDPHLLQLPSSLKILVIDTNNVLPYSFASLPSDLRVFRTATCIPPVENLPPLLTELDIPFPFNQPLNNLPSSLTWLTIGCHFNQPVDNLPSSLTHLAFGNSFNQPVDHLPSSLIYLRLGDAFNQPVDHLPDSLRHLYSGIDFNRPMHHLPPLTLLSCKSRFIFSQAYTLPPSITHVLFGTSQVEEEGKKDPQGVAKLSHLSLCYLRSSKHGHVRDLLQVPMAFKKFTFELFDPQDGEPDAMVEVDFGTRMIFVSFDCTFRPLIASPSFYPSSTLLSSSPPFHFF